MAKFCGKCGSKLNENGLCPNCDSAKIAMEKERQMKVIEEQQRKAQSTNNKQINKNTNGNDQQPISINNCNKQNADANPNNKPPKKLTHKQKKMDKLAAKAKKKADKKAKKMAKKASRTIGQKIKRFFIKLLAIILVFIVLISAVAGVLVYYDVVDIPVVSDILNTFEIKNNNNNDDESLLYVPDDNSLAIDEETGIMYIDNIILIFFEEGTSEQQVEDTVSSINGEIVGSIPAIDQYQVKVEKSTLNDLLLICDELKKFDYVYDATYDAAFFVDGDTIPNDPWTKSIFNDGETWDEANPDGANWWLEAINAMEAWDFNEKMDNIAIGVVDNGFDYGHKDLKEVIKYTSPSNDKAKHGTHVSGIIGAEANNNKGITGIVWNCELYTWDWQLNSIQKLINDVFKLGWSTSNQIMGGTVKLIQKGAKVINLSLGQTSFLSGTTRSDEEVNAQGYNASLYLCSLLKRNYDFLIVQSAGNGNSSEISVDASYNGFFCSINENNCVSDKSVDKKEIINRIIIVGAAQNDGNNNYSQPYWSNAGSRVDICAPGKDIYSTVPGGLSGKYEYLDGTSMAAPIVTGVAALTWSVNSSLSGPEIKKIICDRANTKYEVSDNTSSNHPLVNNYRMINAELSVKAALNYTTKSELGEYTAKNSENPISTPIRNTSSKRDIVLVLDTSSSMRGTPLDETKKAATNFVNTILEEDASIGVVTYDKNADMKSDFTNSKNSLISVINKLDTSGNTNMEAGLRTADEMLTQSSAKKKIIVLMSDGEPNEGLIGDGLITYANKLKGKGIYIYTLGFFESLGDKTAAQTLMEKIASDGCHYEVSDVDSLVFFFGDIADQINGQKYIYVRIACPVDVSVKYNGETLDSSEKRLNTRTSFGTLTFEDSDAQADKNYYSQQTDSKKLNDDRVKILRLKEGEDYDIEIEGTGRGRMNYSIGFMNEDGEYTDFRKFNNIKITRNTQIDTVANVSDKTVLNVDEDGDGKYDLVYKAKANEYGEIVDYSYIIYIVIGALSVIVLLVFVLVIKRKIKKRKLSNTK